MPLTNSVWRGLVSGVLAGLLAGLAAYLLGESHIDAAIAIEQAHTSHHDGGEELVSRGGQKAGLLLALSLAGAGLGALFGSIVALAQRLSKAPPAAVITATAAGGWLAVTAVPFFKYPANPPAVGNPETFHDRTLLWLAAVLVGLAATGAAVLIWKAVPLASALRTAASITAFFLVAGIGYVALPGVNEVPPGFPPTLLWEFRIASLATQTTLWLGIGLVFAILTELAGHKRTRHTVPA